MREKFFLGQCRSDDILASPMKKNAIAIIDFGSQYAHLIATRARRLGVLAHIYLPETPLATLAEYKGIIFSGGPQSVYAKDAPTIDHRIFSLGIPILGLCYGHQLIAHLLGGKVSPGSTKEYGLAMLSVKKRLGIFKDLGTQTQVWMSHGDTVTKAPLGFELYGSTNDCAIAVMGDKKRRIYSAQFHVEVKHTLEGMTILDSFLTLCGVTRDWNMEKFLAKKMAELKITIGDRNVFLLVSGGVDSTVAYALLSKSLGTDRVYGLFVDTGLLRKDEVRQTQESLRKIGIKNFHVFKAAPLFLKGLKGVVEPEKKRAIIGKLFLKVQAQAVRKLKLDPKKWLLGQGTIYPDTIESAGTKYADKIKTHHNRVPEILALIERGLVVEPLAELYKDEVRQLGTKLGLPAEMVWKHPFPGPALAVRILCAKKPVLPKQYVQLEHEINEYVGVNDFTAMILPIQSVGVAGDNRTYKNPVVLQGSTLLDGDLEVISTSITNRFPAVNRVCLLLSPERIKSVKVVPATLTPSRIKLLQELDSLVMKFIRTEGIERKVWQFPTVLVPLHINGKQKEAVVLRPICSDEAMTAHFYKMKRPLLEKLTRLLRPKVSAVIYDITNKPPGTIEWE